MLKINLKIKIFSAMLILTLLPFATSAETLSSSHYNIINPEFGAGGENSSSTNYRSRDVLGSENNGSSSSANYKTLAGFVPPAYPGIPAQPTLTNTGGNMYNTLDFVIATGGNPSDVNYAIAISPDNFATSTLFVQANDSIGTSTVWQTYSAWGGATGQRLVSLVYNTTYTIKVKARYGPDSETGYSITASAATIMPTLSFTVSAVNSGISVAGQITNIATTATSVAYTTLQTGSIKVAAQTVTVSTNANAGYSVTLAQDHDLANNNGQTIAAVVAPNSAPAAWPVGITFARFGYHTTDAALCSGNPTRFSANDTYAAATSTPFEVACNTGPASNDSNSLVYKVEVESLQATGIYRNNLTYVVTALY